MAEWQARLVQHFERADAREIIRNEAEKVTACDGQDPAAVKQYLRELELLDVDHRLLVFERTARGSLLRIGTRWLTEHQQQQEWMAFKTHILQTFVSANANDALRAELRSCTRQPGETLLSYNRRYEELADDAYPGQRNDEQVENLVRMYARGLRDRRLAEKVVTPDKPPTLAVAMQRVAATEERASNLEWLGYEPMEVDALRTVPQAASRAAPTEMKKEVYHLKSQYGKLEAKIDRLLTLQSPPVDGRQRNRPMRTPAAEEQALPTTTRREERRCYYCGAMGHLQRDCRRKRADDTSRRRRPPPAATAASSSA